MTWLLVLTLVLPGQPPIARPVGEMFSLEACRFAGEAMAEALIRQRLAAVVTVSCQAGVRT